MGICGSRDRNEVIIPKKNFMKDEMSELSHKISNIKTEKTTSIHKKIKKEPSMSNLSNYQKQSKNSTKSPNHKKIIFDNQNKSPEHKKITFDIRNKSPEHKKIIFDSPEQSPEKRKLRLKNMNLNTLIQRRTKMRNLKEFSEYTNLKSDRSSSINKQESNQQMKTKNQIIPFSPVKDYQRRKRKSISLVQKSKIGSKLLKEELKIEVTNQSLVEEQSGNPYKKYKIIEKTGDGAYGSVYSAINIITGAKIAMKKILKIQENKVDDMEIKNEIDILKKLDHPNIVKIYEFYNSDSNYFIITEYCKFGELYSKLNRHYSERQLCVLFYQVFSGLCYLHENNIIHRDIKLENIMISDIEKDIKTKEEYFWIKIIDFGTAKIFEKNKKEKTIIGSSYYIAPEVLKKQYNEKCDTWSIGVVLFMLITGIAPFDGDNDAEIIKSITKGKYDKNNKKLIKCSKYVQDLLSKLLEVDIEKRLSSYDALNHPWFEHYYGRSLYSNFEIDDIQIYIDNLINYKFQSKFQQLVLAFLVHNIPYNEEIKLILKLFRYFNISGNCKLTKDELLNGLYKFAEKEIINNCINELFILLDGDNNGYIEYEEFLRACINKKTILSDENLIYAFKFLDKDKSGFVSIKNIMRAFKKSNKIIEEIFKNSIKEVDRDNDGIINFEEFKELMLRVK